MKTDQYSQQIYSEDDIMNIIMSGVSFEQVNAIMVDDTVDIERLITYVEVLPTVFEKYYKSSESIEHFDSKLQSQWRMPREYHDLDIAQYILSLCKSEAELQRVGEELLLYQERNLFNLLRYMKYLVDVMTENKVIWGVGRGSSVASYVLFKLGVHKIDSLYYQLDIKEFLRKSIIK
jgi:DNA polymerase III alpha subunit